MENDLDVILMHDDGRTWRYRIRTAWIKIGVYAILGLILTSGVGLFGSISLWRKLTLISSENHVMQTMIEDMRPRLNRLLFFEQLHHNYDPPSLRDVWQRHDLPRISDVDLDTGLPAPDTLPALLPFLTDGLPPSLPSTDAEDGASRQDSAESRKALVRIGDDSHNETPAQPKDQTISAGDRGTPVHELTEGHEPDAAVGESLPEPESPDNSAHHQAEADNVRLLLRNADMELRFDLRNRSNTTIAGRIEVVFIAADDQIVQATGDDRALWFRIQFFREVRSPLHLPTGYRLDEMSAMRINVVNRNGELFYSQTYPLADLLPGTV